MSERTCKICGGPIRSTNVLLICQQSQKCRRARYMARYRTDNAERIERQTHNCEVCGKPTRARAGVRFCTDCKKMGKRVVRAEAKGEEPNFQEKNCIRCGALLRSHNKTGACQKCASKVRARRVKAEQKQRAYADLATAMRAELERRYQAELERQRREAELERQRREAEEKRARKRETQRECMARLRERERAGTAGKTCSECGCTLGAKNKTGLCAACFTTPAATAIRSALKTEANARAEPPQAEPVTSFDRLPKGGYYKWRMRKSEELGRPIEGNEALNLLYREYAEKNDALHVLDGTAPKPAYHDEQWRREHSEKLRSTWAKRKAEAAESQADENKGNWYEVMMSDA